MGFFDTQSTEYRVLSYLREHTVNINTEKVGSGVHVNRFLFKTLAFKPHDMHTYTLFGDSFGCPRGSFSTIIYTEQRTNCLNCVMQYSENFLTVEMKWFSGLVLM